MSTSNDLNVNSKKRGRKFGHSESEVKKPKIDNEIMIDSHCGRTTRSRACKIGSVQSAVSESNVSEMVVLIYNLETNLFRI